MVSKKPQKKTKNKEDLRERNIVAKISVQIGALLILTYAAMLVLFTLLATALNDTGNTMTGLTALLVLLFCVNLSIQAVRLLRESNRVDHYKQRIVSICFILLLPLIFIASQTLVGRLYMSAAGPADSALITQVFNIIMIASAVIGIVGSIWLWKLLVNKNKLV